MPEALTQGSEALHKLHLSGGYARKQENAPCGEIQIRQVIVKLAHTFHNRAGIESLPRAKLAQEPGKWYRGRHSPLTSKSCTDAPYD